MKVLFDANIVLDILLKRPGFADAALALARSRRPCLSTLSVANIAYIIGRSKWEKVSGPLSFIQNKFRLIAVTGKAVTRAVELAFPDFEDALQFAAAEEANVEAIVTRNLSDFRASSQIAVLGVDALLERMNSAAEQEVSRK